ANRHSARERSPLLRVGELLVEHRVGGARGLPRGVEALPAVLKVSIDVVPVCEVVRDGAVYLLEVQDRERLRDRLGRLTRQKRVHDRIEGHTGPRDEVQAIMLLDVTVAHGGLSHPQASPAPESSVEAGGGESALKRRCAAKRPRGW